MSSATAFPEVQRTAPMLRWTVQQLRALTESGILPEGEPIELIDGYLIRKDRSDRGELNRNHGVRHATGVKRGSRTLDRLTGELAVHVRVQLPVTLSARDEPEPDYCLVRGMPEDFATAHPTAGDLLLVVEVADSSLGFDRGAKCRLYATAGVSVYWIVNLVSDCVEVYEEPSAERGEYLRRSIRSRGEVLTLTLPEGVVREIAVDSLV